MQSPRLLNGVRAFFSDMLMLDEFAHLEKDNLIYPAFDSAVRQDAREQLLRTIVFHLLEKDGDYRELFSTRTTFMNGPLGRIYRVPVAEPDLWSMHEFSPSDNRSGIQTMAGFIALHSHPGRSSPTIRGKAVRELLLCQVIPEPPGDVDFTLFISSEKSRTARERLDIHNSVASCAGCHKLTDVIGLALEHYDGAGQFRTTDAGAAIDTSGDLDGIDFAHADEFGEVLSENPAIPECLVKQVLAYGLGRAAGREDKDWLTYLIDGFIDDDHRLRPLIRTIATSPNFYAVRPGSVGQAPAQQVVQIDNSEHRS